MILWCSIAYLSWDNGPAEWQFGADSLVVARGTYQSHMPKTSLRIVEFGDAPDREWHIKDGVHVASIDESESFADAKGNPWSSREVVNRIEAWAGVTRERLQRPPQVAIR